MRTVEKLTHMRIILSGAHSIDVRARLEYREERPYEVRVLFEPSRPARNCWVLSRDLLLEGLEKGCGAGDVRVFPTAHDQRRLLCLQLRSPQGGEALVSASAAEVAEFLERCSRLVPPGEEGRVVDLDDLVRQLLP